MKKKILAMLTVTALMVSGTISALAADTTVTAPNGTGSTAVNYSKPSSFVLTIPSSLNFSDASGAGTINIASGSTSNYGMNVNIKPTEQLNVYINAVTPTDLSNNVLALHRAGDPTTMLYTKLTLKGSESFVINNGSKVASFSDASNLTGYIKDTPLINTSALYTNTAATTLATSANSKAGVYATNLVFTVKLEAK